MRYLFVSIVLTFFLFTLKITAQDQPRIVSLSPNLTEIILALGGKSSLVGRSSASDYIKEAKTVPVAGDMGNPNLEQIVLLKADIVVASNLTNPSDARIIENLGLKFYLLKTENFEEYYSTVDTLGKILDKNREAEEEIERIKQGLSEFKKENKSIPFLKRPKVFWEIWDNPLITVGNKAFLNEFIELAGGINITANVNRSYFQISKESILTANPDVIIAPDLSTRSVKDMKTSIGWDAVSAVKNNRVYTNIDPNLVNVFGPRILSTIQLIHNLLYNK